MTSRTSSFYTPARPTASIALALLLTLLAVLCVPVAAASAHDELVATDPAADSVLDAAPPALTLTFSAELLADTGTTEVQVTNASGASLTDGAPAVAGTTVTQALLPGAGSYTVLWRVVSSDGHPISGEFAFQVDAAAPSPSATPTEAAAPAPSPDESESTAPEATSSASPSSASPSSAPTAAEEASSFSPVIVGAVLGVFVLAAVVYLLVARARRAGDTGAAPKTDSHAGTGR